MKIKKIKIKNYRAIENIEFNINYSINPIIGINEAGKTSILKAILAFDRTRDKYNNGEHLEYKNKYVINKNICEISAFISLEKSEIQELLKKLGLKTNTKDYQIISSLEEAYMYVLSRTLSGERKEYTINIDGVTKPSLSKITTFLIEKIPYILYFDDFADRVPDEIEFSPDYILSGKLSRNKNRDWQEIIQEIFKRAETDGLSQGINPLIEYLKVKDRDTKDDILSDVQDTLNKEIINEWKRIKKSGKSFADDSDKLELVIVNDQQVFQFKVKDKSNNDKKRTFDINQRSKGFQWFFNYMIKLKFNPNYRGKLENSIFLLDEPGSYLHSSAQSELLNELHGVSKKNTIIFCTHSQFLLNPDVIKLGSIKIAEKSDAKIKLVDYGKYKSSNNKGALSPIYQALQLNYASDFIGKIVITEGVTDYYLMRLLQKYTGFIQKSIKFIPGSGASQSSTLISLAVPFSSNFVVFLDNDKAGKSAYRKYIKEFGEEMCNHLHLYNRNASKHLLEDYLDKCDSVRILNITESEDLKRALGLLFYDTDDRQKNFIDNLSSETKNNLRDIFERISKL